MVEGCNLGKWRGAPLVILYVRRTDRPSQFRGCAPIYILIDLLHPSGKTSSNSIDTGTDCAIRMDCSECDY